CRPARAASPRRPVRRSSTCPPSCSPARRSALSRTAGSAVAPRVLLARAAVARRVAARRARCLALVRIGLLGRRRGGGAARTGGPGALGGDLGAAPAADARCALDVALLALVGLGRADRGLAGGAGLADDRGAGPGRAVDRGRALEQPVGLPERLQAADLGHRLAGLLALALLGAGLELGVHEEPDGVLLDAVEHRLEHVVRLALVLDDRVLLGVRAQ